MWKKIGQYFTFLSQVGKLELTNAVLIALPTFLSFLTLLPAVIKQIDKYKYHCLWRVQIKSSLRLVYLPKKGGLGLINLKKHNEALMLKNLYKFFNKKDIPGLP